MVNTRIIETNEGISDAREVNFYDQMARRLSEKGWTPLRGILKIGITDGLALEVGPGPGYLGLDWLKQTTRTRLVGLDISENMVKLARRNAREFGLESRARYVIDDACRMPFEDNHFDHVFTNGSLHEWGDPVVILKEINRVLKPGGRFFISDLRRDMGFVMRWFLKITCKPKSIRPGLVTSIQASYTRSELENLVKKSGIEWYKIARNPLGLNLTGKKEH